MKQIKLYYDDDCPFCKEYSKYIELRKKFDISLINARDDLEKMALFKDKGFDINSGMIVELDEKIYQGADAAIILDDCIKKDKLIDKILSFFVKLPGFKQVIYPVVLVFRKAILKIFGKSLEIKF